MGNDTLNSTHFLGITISIDSHFYFFGDMDIVLKVVVLDFI